MCDYSSLFFQVVLLKQLQLSGTCSSVIGSSGRRESGLEESREQTLEQSNHDFG